MATEQRTPESSQQRWPRGQVSWLEEGRQSAFLTPACPGGQVKPRTCRSLVARAMQMQNSLRLCPEKARSAMNCNASLANPEACLKSSRSCLQGRSCWCQTDVSLTIRGGFNSARKTTSFPRYRLTESFHFYAEPSLLQEARRWLLGAQEVRSGCWHMLGTRGSCPRLAGVALLQVRTALGVSRRLEHSQEGRGGQQMKCLQGKYPFVRYLLPTDTHKKPVLERRA